MEWKICSREEKCLDPNGPKLSVGEFYSNKHRKDGLNNQCKTCCKDAVSRSIKKHPETGKSWNSKNPDYHKKWWNDHPEYRKQWLDKHPDYQKNYQKGWLEKNRDYHQKWRQQHPNYQKEWEGKHSGYFRRAALNWYRTNTNKSLVYQKNRRTLYPGLDRERSQKRRARRKNLRATFNKEQWQLCLEYWGFRCAYCGQPEGLWHFLAQDHFVPESKGGEYTHLNIVPACHARSGAPNGGYCNNNKSAKHAQNWLEEKYGERHTKQIIEKIKAYFEWIDKKIKPSDLEG